ncbi:hypothetical protein [Novosphingobium sp. FKTRR1]|uniref:hypothetical protein n=1 Tax=Novosphingobium sp. FKTRR1 TaxID=2879118 RepID=UPI001CEFC85F|nr:hypothetical protein [Novosphingobium sp. FKTRR1]
MTKERYPAISDFSLAVILHAKPGAAITPATVDAALADRPQFSLTADSYETVIADLAKHHMIEGDDNELTGLADNFARMWRAFLAKQARGQP